MRGVLAMNYVCGHCRQACQGELVDFGVGVTEFWGNVSVDECIQFVSKCCQVQMYEDYELDEPVPLEEQF